MWYTESKYIFKFWVVGLKTVGERAFPFCPNAPFSHLFERWTARYMSSKNDKTLKPANILFKRGEKPSRCVSSHVTAKCLVSWKVPCFLHFKGSPPPAKQPQVMTNGANRSRCTTGKEPSVCLASLASQNGYFRGNINFFFWVEPRSKKPSCVF